MCITVYRGIYYKTLYTLSFRSVYMIYCIVYINMFSVSVVYFCLFSFIFLKFMPV